MPELLFVDGFKKVNVMKIEDLRKAIKLYEDHKKINGVMNLILTG